MAGFREAMKAGGAEEDDRVLDLLAAKSGQGLGVLGENAQNPPIGAVEEALVFVGQRSRIQGRFAGQKVTFFGVLITV
jgi:hypothetical protein